MPKSNRGGNRGRSTSRSSRSAGFLDVAREAPLATAAAAAGAVAAGVFLWSKRSQISDQFNNLTERFQSDEEAEELEFAEAVSESSSARGAKPRRRTGMTATGSGRSGAPSAGGDLNAGISGRSRA